MPPDIDKLRELDALVRGIIDEAAALFPGGSFDEGRQMYEPGELALALDSVFWTVKNLGRKAPVSLYDKILAANEKMAPETFSVSHYDPIKPDEVH